MSRRIQLVAEGVRVLARLEDEAAPVTCQRVWDSLPIDDMMLHVRFSGHAGYIMIPSLHGTDQALENQRTFFTRGMVGLILWPHHGELTIAYGQAQPRGFASTLPAVTYRQGQISGYSCHIATVEDGQIADFYKVIAAARTSGTKSLHLGRE